VFFFLLRFTYDTWHHNFQGGSSHTKEAQIRKGAFGPVKIRRPSLWSWAGAEPIVDHGIANCASDQEVCSMDHHIDIGPAVSFAADKWDRNDI
jgi:hypothetical protein